MALLLPGLYEGHHTRHVISSNRWQAGRLRSLEGAMPNSGKILCQPGGSNNVIDISHHNGTRLRFDKAKADGMIGVIQKAIVTCLIQPAEELVGHVTMEGV
jgi:hypothetical protein